MDNLEKAINEVLQLLSKKKNILDDIYKHTILQKKAIESQDDEELKKCIDKKQELITSIDKLDEDFLETVESVKSKLGINSFDDIKDSNNLHLKALKEATTEIKNIIEKIFILEKENSVKIKKEYDDIKSKLKEISGGKKAISAYGGYNKPTSNGAFIDNKK